MDGWMSRTMGEIGEVIQAERIGLGDRKREGEGRKRKSVFSAHFVNPNIQWITLPLEAGAPSRLRLCPEIRASPCLLLFSFILSEKLRVYRNFMAKERRNNSLLLRGLSRHRADVNLDLDFNFYSANLNFEDDGNEFIDV